RTRTIEPCRKRGNRCLTISLRRKNDLSLDAIYGFTLALVDALKDHCRQRTISQAQTLFFGLAHSALLEAHRRRPARWQASSIALLNPGRFSAASDCSPFRQAS